MKRILLGILVVLALAVPCVFASDLELELRAIPYLKQKFVNFESGSAGSSSVQGFGSSAGLKYVFNNGTTAGVEILIDTVSYIEAGNEATFADASLMGKVGLATPVDSRIGFELGIAGGIDYKCWADQYEFYPTAKINFGFRFKCSEKTDGVCLNVGALVKLEWNKSVWADYTLAPYLGLDYKI